MTTPVQRAATAATAVRRVADRDSVPTPVPTPVAPSRLRRLSLTDAATVMVFALTGGLLLRPAKDPDLLWHLASGRWILAHHRVPRTDPFSWTAPGRKWIAHEWLTETLFWGIHRLGGFTALTLFITAVVLGAMAVSWTTMRRLGASGAAANALILLGAFAALPTWDVRPQLLSFALISVLVALTTAVWQRPEHTRRLWLLVPMMLVWANLHGGYIFGCALLGAFAVGSSWEALRSREDAERRTLAITAWLVVAAAGSATLANPNGLTGFLYPFSYLGDNASTRYVNEWFAPAFSNPQYWPFALFLVLLVVVAGFRLRGSAQVPAHAWLQMVPLAALGVQSVRNIGPFVIVASPWIARSLTRPGRARTRVAPRGAEVVHLLVSIAAVVSIGALTVPAITNAAQARWRRRTYPVAASAWMTANPRDHVLNQYDWGGYFILEPRMPVAMDGRPDMYGDAAVDRYVTLWWAQPGWEQLLAGGGYERVVGSPAAGIIRALTNHAGWTVVHHDDHVVVIDRDPVALPSPSHS